MVKAISKETLKAELKRLENRREACSYHEVGSINGSILTVKKFLDMIK